MRPPNSLPFWLRAGLVGLLAPALALAGAAADSAQASPTDALDVSFGGSLVGTTQYTTQGDEAQRGTLHRIDGGEAQVPAGVALAGNAQGLRFDASNLDLDSGNQSFVMEMRYTATATADLATYLSAGGNVFVRAQGGKLRYGYSSNATGAWADTFKETALPALNTEHVLSLHYRRTGSAVTMDLSLDGDKLPAVTGASPATVSGGLGKAFGFGNEVNADGGDRGIRGTVHQVRVNGTDGLGDGFELQPRRVSIDQLNLGFDGVTAGGRYLKAATEVAEGEVALVGAPAVGASALTLSSATQALVFTPSSNALPNADLDAGFVAEAEFTPSGTQRELATLIGVGGNFFVRLADGALQYGYSGNAGGTWRDFRSTTAALQAGEKHIVSVAYVPDGRGGAEITVWLDGVEQAKVAGDLLSRQDRPGVVVFGNEANSGAQNRALTGSIDRVRFALLDGGFVDGAFTFQSLTPPVECQEGEIVPGNYVPVSRRDCDAHIIAKASAVRPTEAQQTWQEYQLTGFMHFGINTFYDQEWGHGTEDPARFNPTGKVDVDAWVKTLRDQGVKMGILTLKHHDGFQLWPSRYSTFNVASTPWLDGKGDIMKEFAAAAKKYGLKVGVYLSPADSWAEEAGIFANGSAKSTRTIPTLVQGDDRAGSGLPSFQYEATDYGQYFLNQLYEVLTGYGAIDEVWFDGAGGNTSGSESFDYVAYYDLIRKLQPGALIAVGGNDIRWVGNEGGYARDDEWAVVSVNRPADGGKIDAVNEHYFNTSYDDAWLVSAVRGGRATDLHWWPSEADMKLTSGWFAHPGDSPKSGSTLLNSHWDKTVGQNAVMLLNVPPTTAGSFAPASVTALQDFASLRRQHYGKDVALGVTAVVGDATTDAVTDANTRTSWVSANGADRTPVMVDLGRPQEVSRISVGEDTLAHGQQIRGFTVEYLRGDQWVQAAAASTVGVNRIVRLAAPVTAQQWRLTVTSARGAYGIANFSLYQQQADPGRPSEIWIDCSAPTAGTGTRERPLNSLEQLRQLDLAPSAAIHFRSGASCEASSTNVWLYGTDADPAIVDTYDGSVMPTIGGQSAAEWFVGKGGEGITLFPGAPTNEPPVVAGIADKTAVAGEPVQIQVSATDPDGPLVYSAEGLPAGIAVDASSGTISGSTTVVGRHGVRITVTDARGAAASTSFTLTVTRAVEPSPTPSATVKPTPTPTAKPTGGWSWEPSAPYSLPGLHRIGGRMWNTSCEKYSQTQRCRTDIWASVVVRQGGGYVVKQGWAFNNLTYLPAMTRAQWAGNPLAANGAWKAEDGRIWSTRCDTAATGRGACRSYVWTTVVTAQAKPQGGYTYRQSQSWVFNNLVLFRP